MSKLITEDDSLVCSGDKLKVLEKSFIDLLETRDHEKWLADNVTDKTKFLHLYRRWKEAKKDDSTFNCGYSSTIFNPLPDTRITMPDPMQVARIEKRLKRKLSEEEKAGEDEIYLNGTLVVINKVVFPDDF